MTGLSAASSLLLSTHTGVDVLRRFANAKFSMPQSCSVSDYNAVGVMFICPALSHNRLQMDNSQEQDPCQVAWALLPACFGSFEDISFISNTKPLITP